MEKHEICVCGCLSFSHGGFHPLSLVVVLPLSHNATDFSVCDFPGRPMPGQKARLQSRLPFLLSMTLKLPGRLPGSSPPISTNQVTFENMLSYTQTLHRCVSPESVNVSK